MEMTLIPHIGLTISKSSTVKIRSHLASISDMSCIALCSVTIVISRSNSQNIRYRIHLLSGDFFFLNLIRFISCYSNPDKVMAQ